MPKGKPITPLDLDEIENDPSLEGLVDRYRPSRDPVGARPIGTTPEGIEPTGAEPTHRTPTRPRPIGSKPAAPAGSMASANLAPELSDVLAELADVPRPSKSRGKTMRATRVEDGHSQTQDAVYWYLWRLGKQVNGSRSRFVQAGYGQIQAALGIDRSNIQDAIRELLKKLSIRVFRASTVGSATIYEVLCCEDIIAKRKREGLVWVRKYGTRRADLLRSPDDEDSEPAGLAPVGATPIGVAPPGLTTSGGITPTPRVGVAPTGSGLGCEKG